MGARIIDGRALATEIRRDVAEQVAALRAGGQQVRLDAVLVDHPAASSAKVYARNQAETCGALGIEYELHELDGASGAERIAQRVLELNVQPEVHAIMVHLPLPKGVDAYEIQSLIHPSKDVEGVNPANIGNIVYGRSSIAPCTALAVLEMIHSTGINLRGSRAAVVGASDIVGKPIAVLLMRHEATVCSCNEHTRGTVSLTANADVLVAAAGVAGLVRRDWVKPGAVVIDVGIHRLEGADGSWKTVGDVDFDDVQRVAGWISPVPGGVGPVTVAMLLRNVVAAAIRAQHPRTL